MAKKYRKCEEIVKILREMIKEKISNSCYFLPSEVAMSEEIGVSRITLRKALAKLDMEGIIRRDRVKTEIVEKRDILSNCGKILFVASAHYSTFIIPAIERLWIKLGPEVIARGGNLELFYVNHMTTFAEWKEKFSQADVIFLGTNDFKHSDATIKLYKKAMQEKIVFSLLETISATNSIYLDNYSVGCMAAQILIDAGCRKIAGICPDYMLLKNDIFAKRMKGFKDVLKKAGLMHLGAEKLIPYRCDKFHSEIGDKYHRTTKEALERSYAEGDDGVFLATDEEIGLISMNLLRRKIIPNKLKFLSVNGVGDAMRNNPPVSCLSHATNKVVDEVMKQLQLIAENKFIAPVNIMVKSDLYPNNTLGMDLGLHPVNEKNMAELVC